MLHLGFFPLFFRFLAFWHFLGRQRKYTDREDSNIEGLDDPEQTNLPDEFGEE